MIEQTLQSNLIGLMRHSGDLGVFLAMFLESSIVPVPSEVIIIGAGAIGIPLVSILIFGALGSTAGAIVGYLIGRFCAEPLILKFGKYVFIKPHHVQKAEAFARKYGPGGVLIGRLIPVVPFKVFSIASGITRIPVAPFIICTLVGVIPRIYILALFGTVVLKYKKATLAAIAVILIAFIAYKIIKGRASGCSKEKHSGK